MKSNPIWFNIGSPTKERIQDMKDMNTATFLRELRLTINKEFETRLETLFEEADFAHDFASNGLSDAMSKFEKRPMCDLDYSDLQDVVEMMLASFSVEFQNSLRDAAQNVIDDQVSQIINYVREEQHND